MTVDTLEYATKLEKAGVSREQAAAHAEALRSAVAGELATKADLKSTESLLRGDIAALRTELKGDIAGVRVEMSAMETRFTKYLLAQSVGTVVLTVSLVGILLRLMR